MHIIVALIFFFMMMTLLVLITGIVFMMKGGALNTKYGNKLMVARVGFQALTIACIGIFLYMGHK